MRRAIGSLLLVPILLLSMASAALAVSSSAFSGHWEATDPIDGSNLDAYISGGSHVRILYTDDNATQGCEGASTPVFTSLLTGIVHGDELHSTMHIAKCGTAPLPYLTGLEIAWTLDDGGNVDPSDDLLTNSFGEEFTRAG